MKKHVLDYERMERELGRENKTVTVQMEMRRTLGALQNDG